jgi:hypothetical protein
MLDLSAGTGQTENAAHSGRKEGEPVTIAQILSLFVHDKQSQTILALILVDLILGVAAALKLGTFRLAYLANFARNDVLGKVAPFLVISAAADVAGGVNIVIPGLDLKNMATGMFVGISAAMVGSILSSLKDLTGAALPEAVAGHTPPPPHVQPPVA